MKTPDAYAAGFAHAPVGMIREGSGGTVLEVNHALCDLLGIDGPEDACGRPVDSLYADADALGDRRAALLRGDELGPAEVRLAAAGDEAVWVEERSAVVRIPGGRTEILRVLVDVTARRRREADLEHLAHHDALTDLANRRLLEDRAEQALALAERRGARVAVAYVDLVDFKEVNERFGHAGGDEALERVSEALRGAVRSADTAARVGGDEFALLLSDVEDRDAACRTVERILQRISSDVVLGGDEDPLLARAGLAVYPDDGLTFEALFEAADEALIRAKREGIPVTTPIGREC